MTITYHREIYQGSDEWHALRRGVLTASEFRHIMTPSGKTADNDKSRAHVWEIAAQRISGYTEPSYVNDDMLRGMDDEIVARGLYAKRVAPVAECGFITNDEWGFTLGCSPDGLVGDDGVIEIKSRRQRFHLETIAEGAVPPEYVLQVQAALLVTRREWLDYVSFSGGLPMWTIRVTPDARLQAAMIEAASIFEARVTSIVEIYRAKLKALGPRVITTARTEREMHL